MPLPAGEPTTLELTKAWMKMEADDVVDDDVITACVDAVNVLVRGLPVAQALDTDPAPETWPASIRLGARMLAARYARRRNTPGGVEVAGQFGVAYVRRVDPDVAQLLQLGDYAAPGVG